MNFSLLSKYDRNKWFIAIIRTFLAIVKGGFVDTHINHCSLTNSWITTNKTFFHIRYSGISLKNVNEFQNT